MKISSDIERLRSAEKDAVGIVQKAEEEARAVRGEAEKRIAELNGETDSAIASMRVKKHEEQEREVAAIFTGSRTRLTEECHAVTARLADGKQDAVKLVVEALKTL